MTEPADLFKALAAPFPPEAVSWRVGSMTKDKTKARALAYIDARDVMRRLDEVVSPANWQCSYTPMPNGTTCCAISIRVDGEWISKANGAETLPDYDKPEAKEIAVKGSYSDAFKRAAVLWGVGQYLYDLDSPWVKVDEWKQIDKSELPKLRALLPKATPFGDKPANTGIQQKSAYQSRKDGDYTALIEEMKLQPTPETLKDWATLKKERIWAMPDNWQEHFREAYEAQMDALRGRVMA